MTSPRFAVEPHGALWLVTDTTTGAQYIHLTEQAARQAARDDISTGVTPSVEQPTEEA